MLNPAAKAPVLAQWPWRSKPSADQTVASRK